MADDDPVVGLSFRIRIEGVDLGPFATCEGLGCEVVLETRQEGGNNGYVWQLPTRLRYPNVKLSRPLGPDTTKVARWFSEMATGVRKRQHAYITALRADGTKVAEWGLLDVVPVRWQGPAFNDTARVYNETVEIAHGGYLDVG